jgi:hypothetical protein
MTTISVFSDDSNTPALCFARSVSIFDRNSCDWLRMSTHAQQRRRFGRPGVVWVGPDPSDIDDAWAVSSDGRFLVYRDVEFKLALHDLHTRRTRHLSV